MRAMIGIASLGAIVLGLASCSHVELPGHPPSVARGLPNEPLPPLQFDWPQGTEMGVSLSFDDARASQLDVGMPLLDSFGVRATFYVSIAPMRERLSDWKAVLATGHESGTHSMRHACTTNFPFSKGKALEDYTLEQMAAELDQANAEIERSLGVRPVTFAYPCGQKFVGRGVNAKSYVPVVASRFLAGRGWRDEAPTAPAVCDLAQLMTMELDGLTWEQLKILVEQARKTGGWLVLCGHDIGEGGRQTVRIDTLRAFCEYAKDPKNGVWVDTVANIGQYVAKQRSATGRSQAKPTATR